MGTPVPLQQWRGEKARQGNSQRTSSGVTGIWNYLSQPDNYKEMAADLNHNQVGGGPTHKCDSPSRFCSAALFAVTILSHQSEIFWPHSNNNWGRPLFWMKSLFNVMEAATAYWRENSAKISLCSGILDWAWTSRPAVKKRNTLQAGP